MTHYYQADTDDIVPLVNSSSKVNEASSSSSSRVGLLKMIVAATVVLGTALAYIVVSTGSRGITKPFPGLFDADDFIGNIPINLENDEDLPLVPLAGPLYFQK